MRHRQQPRPQFRPLTPPLPRNTRSLTPKQELLVQRLPPILRRGQDTTACLKIAEGHALLGGARRALRGRACWGGRMCLNRCETEWLACFARPVLSPRHPPLPPAHAGLPAVAPLLPQLAAAVTRSLAAVVTAAQQQQQQIAALVASAGQPGAAQRQQQQTPAKGLTPELSGEGTAAAGLLTLLVQLSDQAAAAAAAGGGGGAPELPAELEPAAKAAAAVAAADFGGGVVRLPSSGLTLVEACLEVRGAVLLCAGVAGGWTGLVGPARRP